MGAVAARDRFAVWTYDDAGEEIACGDPSVTDAERAAAGRETVANRWQALLPGNRSRAAARYAAGVLTDGQDIARVWRPRDPAELRARLGAAPLAVWAEGDVLHVLWQGQADEVQLGAGVQPRLWPVEGADDLWEASLRIRRLDEAVITIAVVPRCADDGESRRMPDMLVWRGPRAAVAWPAAELLRGTVEEHTFDSAALGAPRQVTVYRPPVPPGRLPGCSRAVSAGRPGNGPNVCSAPACPAGTPNGSAGMTPSGGTSNSRPPWPGC